MDYEIFVTQARKEVVNEFIGKILEDDIFLYGVAATEPDHGSDVHLPYDAPETMKTFAEKKGDEYILNGRKLWISNAGIAKQYHIHARTKRGVPLSEGMSTFVVPVDTPGFSSGKIANKLGCRLEVNGELVLDDVHVPARYLIGEENKALAARDLGLGIMVNHKSHVLLGLLQAIYDVTLEYARTRIQGGKPIIQHPTIGIMLAEIWAQIEAGRSLLYQNAWRIDNQQYDPKTGWATRAYMIGIAGPIVTKAMEIHGAVGHEKGTFMEKYLRDVYSQLHGCGLRTIALLKARTLT
jgi:alkylation response protein AidB-like acyl-CoA dehydrogenase